MASVNKVILVGNLGADPETRYLPSGDAVSNIRLATTDRYKDKASGEMKEATEWHTVVLFGRTASQLSPLEAAQLASALSGLAGGGGFDVIGNLRTFAGLDRLALGGGDAASGAVSISGGKYLTENVYLELTGGGRDGGAAQVEWRVKKSLSILSRVGGQGDGRLAIRWRRDY